VVFNYKPGDDKLALDKMATEIQKEMQAQITSSKTLFGPRTKSSDSVHQFFQGGTAGRQLS